MFRFQIHFRKGNKLQTVRRKMERFLSGLEIRKRRQLQKFLTFRQRCQQIRSAGQIYQFLCLTVFHNPQMQISSPWRQAANSR